MEGCARIQMETVVGGHTWIETWTMVGYDRIESWMKELVSRIGAWVQEFHGRGKTESRSEKTRTR